MGEPTPPDPGDFETGDECLWCTYGDDAIFEPEKTPLYVQVDVYVGDAIEETFILKQDEVSPCKWGIDVFDGTSVYWESTAGPPGVTILRIYWTEDHVIHRSFNTFPDSTRKCETGLANIQDDEDRFGDYATVTWNEDINEAAYDAQFP